VSAYSVENTTKLEVVSEAVAASAILLSKFAPPLSEENGAADMGENPSTKNFSVTLRRD
jgi:hypothetical protein